MQVNASVEKVEQKVPERPTMYVAIGRGLHTGSWYSGPMRDTLLSAQDSLGCEIPGATDIHIVTIPGSNVRTKEAVAVQLADLELTERSPATYEARRYSLLAEYKSLKEAEAKHGS